MEYNIYTLSEDYYSTKQEELSVNSVISSKDSSKAGFILRKEIKNKHPYYSLSSSSIKNTGFKSDIEGIIFLEIKFE